MSTATQPEATGSTDGSPSTASGLATATGPTISASTAILVFLVGVTALHLALHHREHGVVNVHQAVLAFFLVLNLLVNFWEIGLYYTLDRIADEYEAAREPFRGRALDRIMEVFDVRVPLSKLFSFSSWTGIWSGYALFDPGYARRDSFGFSIDVGNGFSTIVPATLFTFGMTYELLPPQIMGMIGVAMFWQMFYGTVVYFFQFVVNRRHVGHGPKELALFVGLSNGMWFVFPLWGIAVSAALVLQNSYAIFR